MFLYFSSICLCIIVVCFGTALLVALVFVVREAVPCASRELRSSCPPSSAIVSGASPNVSELYKRRTSKQHPNYTILLWHLFAFNSYSAEAEATCCLMNSMRSRRPRCADQCMGEKPCSNLSSYPFGRNTMLNTKLVKQCAPKDQILRSPNWIHQCLSSGLWRQAFISHMHQHLSVEGIYMKYLFVHYYVLTHFDILRM